MKKKTNSSTSFEISKGTALFKEWEYPWVSTMSFNDKDSYVDIKLDTIIYMRLTNKNSGLLIERPDFDKLVVRMACNTDGFEVGKYKYSMVVRNKDNSVFLEESGDLTVSDKPTNSKEGLPEVTNQRPWYMPYTTSTGKTDMPNQDDFEKQLEESLENDS